MNKPNLTNQYFHKRRFKPVFSNVHMMAAFDYLLYVFNAQVSSYEAPLRVSSPVEKLSRDDRNVLFSYK